MQHKPPLEVAKLAIRAKVCPKCFADLLEVACRHLQALAFLVVEFVCKKAMDAAHVADRRNQNVEKNRRKGPTCSHARIALEYFFVMKVHLLSYRKTDA